MTLKSKVKRSHPVPKTITLKEVVSSLQKLSLKNKFKTTLLGIGPMSEVVLQASLELARDYDFPVIFIASRNQVDTNELGGGYVQGWNQTSFSKSIDRIAKEVGFRGLIFKCRDHGGPWQRDEELQAKLKEKEAMEKGKLSFIADLEAGFHLLHIDPTKDPHFEKGAPLKITLRRTLQLIEWTEKERKRRGLPPVSYEVGTEDIVGGLTAVSSFQQFIAELNKRLDYKGLPLPAFIVGQTGTKVMMKRNVGTFNSQRAAKLAEVALKYGIGFKEHNTDYLPKDILKEHPELGITAANVAPEFGVAETEACLKLAKKEEKINTPAISKSNFIPLIQRAVLKEERWRKWLLKEESHLTKEEIIKNKKRLEEITQISGHYVFHHPQIRRAREKLYENLKQNKIVRSPEEEVKSAVKKKIKKYIRAFNLEGSTTQILQSLTYSQ
ncbi:MAG: sugar-phosphate kinase [Armatimonadetes bacterium CG07_land_8_20_14_0_80_40_9]|nr:MAG: sugar-phosphate kinase [Armatimonadetes bacterium CG07_land_8_20_14_0_80_40_9]